MCVGISCEVGVADGRVIAWFGDPSATGADRDSHTSIRKFHGLSELCHGANVVAPRRVPVEFHHGADASDASQYKLAWDHIDAPVWWDSEEHEPQLRRLLAQEVARRIQSVRETGVWPGTVVGVTRMPGGCITIGGDLYLGGATIGDGALGAVKEIGGHLILGDATIGDGAFGAVQAIGGDLCLGRATIGDGTFAALQEVGGDLYLVRATIGDGTFAAVQEVGGDLCLVDATMPAPTRERLESLLMK